MDAKSFRYYLDFVWVMTVKEIKARYKGAVFGFLWLILNPLLQMLIIGTIFSYFMNIPDYFLYLFSGLLPWQFFSMTVLKNTSAFVNERSLLQKAVFPKTIIPVSITMANTFNLLVSEALLILTVALASPENLLNLWRLIPSTLWIVILTLGCSLLTASLTVRFRDVAFFIQTLMLLWFYATPILYSGTQLPRHLHQFLELNPLTYPISLFQSTVTAQPLETPSVLVANLFITALFLLGGGVLYRKQSPHFVDWL